MFESRSFTNLSVRALLLLMICVVIRVATLEIAGEEFDSWETLQLISGAIWDVVPIVFLLVLGFQKWPVAGSAYLIALLLFCQAFLFGYLLIFGQVPNAHELSLLPKIIGDLPRLIEPVKPLGLFLIVVGCSLIYGIIDKGLPGWKLPGGKAVNGYLSVTFTAAAVLLLALNCVSNDQRQDTRTLYDGNPLAYIIESGYRGWRGNLISRDENLAQVDLYDPSHYSFTEDIPARRSTSTHGDATTTDSKVVFVLLESVMQWPFGRKFEGRQFGESLFSEFKNIIAFDNTFSVWDHTLESLESLFYSLPPTADMINEEQATADKNLLGYLVDDGYQIMTLSAYWDNFYSTKVALTCFVRPHRYYSHEQLIEIGGTGELEKGYLSDETLYSAAYQLIRSHFNHRKDFMLLVNAATHPPYEQHRVLESGYSIFDNPETAWQRQVSTFDYALRQLTRFMQKVRNTPGLEQTVFVITSDHVPPGAWKYGEAALDQNEFFQLFKIPFLIILPDDAGTGIQRINQWSTQLDIAPTLMDFLQIDEIDSRFVGQSLLRENNTVDRYIATRFWDAVGPRIRYGDKILTLDENSVIKSETDVTDRDAEQFNQFQHAYQSRMRQAPRYTEERLIPRGNWSLVNVDSFQDNGPATYAFDAKEDTIWHTEWFPNVSPQPHEMVIDLGDTYNIDGFRYLPRTDGVNGTVRSFELYIGNSVEDLVEPVLTHEFCGQSEKQVLFPPQQGRFVKFRTLSEINGQPFASAAEINFLGTRRE